MKKAKTFLVSMLVLCGLTACTDNQTSDPSIQTGDSSIQTSSSLNTPSTSTSTSTKKTWDATLQADMQANLGEVLPYFELGTDAAYGFYDDPDYGIMFYAEDYDSNDFTSALITIFTRNGYSYSEDQDIYFKENNLGTLLVEIFYYDDGENFGNCVYAYMNAVRADWSEEEKANMLATWGFEIPFFELGENSEYSFEEGSLTAYDYSTEDLTASLAAVFTNLGFTYDGEDEQSFEYYIKEIDNGCIIEVAIRFIDDPEYGGNEVYGYVLYPYEEVKNEFLSEENTYLSDTWLEDEFKAHLSTKIELPDPLEDEILYTEDFFTDEETEETEPYVWVFFLDNNDYINTLQEAGWTVALNEIYLEYFGIELYEATDPDEIMFMEIQFYQVVEGLCVSATIYRIGEETTILSQDYNGEYVIMDEAGTLKEMSIANDYLMLDEKFWLVTGCDNNDYTLMNGNESMTLTIDNTVTLTDTENTYKCFKVTTIKLDRDHQGTYTNDDKTVVITASSITLNGEPVKVVTMDNDGIYVVINDTLYVMEITVSEATSLVIKNVLTSEVFASLDRDMTIIPALEDATFDMTSVNTIPTEDAADKVVFESGNGIVTLEKSNSSTNANNGLPENYSELRIYGGQKLTFEVLDGTMTQIVIEYSSIKGNSISLEDSVVTGGTASYGTNTITITADANADVVSIQFNGSSGHVKVTSITVSAE